MKIVEQLSSLEMMQINRYSNFGLQSVWLKSDKKFIVSPQIICAFEEFKKNWVIAGDPIFMEMGQKKEAFLDLLRFAEKKQVKICGYYFSESLKDLLSEDNSVYFVKMGTRSITDHANYSLNGYKKRDVRRSLNQLKRSDLNFQEIPCLEKAIYLDKITSLESAWLKTKKNSKIMGRIGFLLSSPRSKYSGSEKERWFVVKDQNSEIQAFASFLPYKNGSCYYLDHMVQRPKGHKYAIDIALTKSLLKFRDEGISEVSLGMNFCWSVKPRSVLGALFWLNMKSSLLYNSRGLRTFKNKFADYEEDGFLMLSRKNYKWIQLIRLLRVTYRQRLGLF